MAIDWKVISVFDPDGTGRDFAYTVGLHDRGLPELFLWARPTEGDDPGADWVLSDLDLMHQLNDLGTQLVDGTIAPGLSTDVAYDGGATTATLALLPPVAFRSGRLDAFQVDPDASISEIRWSLHRAPIGERRELTPAEVDQARRRLAAFISDDGAATVDFPAAATFGPLTPVVEVLRMKTRALEDTRANLLVDAAYLGHLPEGEVAIVEQAARRVGLVDEVHRSNDLAIEDARALGDRVFAAEPDLLGPATNLLASILAVAYGTEIVRHAIPDDPPVCSELLWALLDPDGERTHRFVSHVASVDPPFARLVVEPEREALAAIVEPIDNDVKSELLGLWVLAAAGGHGSGLWLAALLLCRTTPMEVTWRAGLALAVAGFHVLDIPLAPELTHLDDTIRTVAADVRAVALRRAS